MFFVRGVVETVKKLRWDPGFVHCIGWISSLSPMYLRRIFADDPTFAGSKIIYSLFSDKFEGTLDPRFAEKLLLEGFSQEDIASIADKPVDWIALNKLAIDYSDAVAQSSPDIDPRAPRLHRKVRQAVPPVLGDRYRRPRQPLRRILQISPVAAYPTPNPYMKYSRLIPLAAISSLAFLACEEGSSIGSSIVSDQVEIVIDSAFTVTGHSVPVESVVSRSEYQLLGSIDAKATDILPPTLPADSCPQTSSLQATAWVPENVDSIRLAMVMRKGDMVGDSVIPLGLEQVSALQTPP